MATVDRRGITVGEATTAASLYANSGVAMKAAVKAASTANLTLSGEQTVDGVALSADDRVLVKDQSTVSENGIYIVSTGDWSRSTDMDGAGEIAYGTTVFVVGGTLNAETFWYVSTANPIVIGATSVAWIKAVRNASQINVEDSAGYFTGTNVEAVLAELAPKCIMRVDYVDIASGDPTTDYEAGDTIDGGTLVAGQTVMRASPTPHASDGVYVVPASGAASRHPLFSTYDAHAGAAFIVRYGTIYAKSWWMCVSDSGGTLDTTAIDISHIYNVSGPGVVFGPRLETGISRVEVHGQASTDGQVKILREADAGGGGTMLLHGRKTDGSAPDSGHRLGGFFFGSTNPTGPANIQGGAVVAYAAENWTYGSANGTRLQFETCPNTTAARVVRLVINDDGGIVVKVAGADPTGGNKGDGTINAGAVYDDNTLLTDHVFDLYLDGKCKSTDNARIEAWSAEFEQNRAWVYDIGEYGRFWKEHRHLPAMPGRDNYVQNGLSTGELINRLWETVETQAVHIQQLNERLERAEKLLGQGN